MAAKNIPNVFKYTDYRLYLREYYCFMKESTSFFAHRYFLVCYRFGSCSCIFHVGSHADCSVYNKYWQFQCWILAFNVSPVAGGFCLAYYLLDSYMGPTVYIRNVSLRLRL